MAGLALLLAACHGPPEPQVQPTLDARTGGVTASDIAQTRQAQRTSADPVRTFAPGDVMALDPTMVSLSPQHLDGVLLEDRVRLDVPRVQQLPAEAIVRIPNDLAEAIAYRAAPGRTLLAFEVRPTVMQTPRGLAPFSLADETRITVVTGGQGRQLPYLMDDLVPGTGPAQWFVTDLAEGDDASIQLIRSGTDPQELSLLDGTPSGPRPWLLYDDGNLADTLRSSEPNTQVDVPLTGSGPSSLNVQLSQVVLTPYLPASGTTADTDQAYVVLELRWEGIRGAFDSLPGTVAGRRVTFRELDPGPALRTSEQHFYWTMVTSPRAPGAVPVELEFRAGGHRGVQVADGRTLRGQIKP